MKVVGAAMRSAGLAKIFWIKYLYFTAPATSPLIRYLLKSTTIIMAGIMAITPIAHINPLLYLGSRNRDGLSKGFR